MTAVPIACMGGFCTQRDRCARYHVEGVIRLRAAERLCSRNMDDQFVSLDGFTVSHDVSFGLDQRFRRVFGDDYSMGSKK